MKKQLNLDGMKRMMLVSLLSISLAGLAVYAEHKLPGRNIPPDIKFRVAAAANLMHVLETLTASYMDKYPHVKIEHVFGSSGNLTAQILHGAPFHLFLSADSSCPERIAAAGLGEGNITVYAYGLLCLASQHPLDEAAGLSQLADSRFKTIALAKPQLAPYGQAAMQSLQRSGLHRLDSLLTRVVWAENISQAFQYVKTGAADAGFVALPAVIGQPRAEQSLPGPAVAGIVYWLKISPVLYDRITQSLLVIKTADPAAREEAFNFVHFLTGAAGRQVLLAAGYGLP